MKVSVLGCGRWGSFIGWYLVNNGHDVIQWGTEGNYTFDVLKNTGKNEYVELDERITLSSDLGFAINNSDIIIISISSQSLRSFMKRVAEFDTQEKKFILCMKGIIELSQKDSAWAGDGAGGTPAARNRQASTVGEAATAEPIERPNIVCNGKIVPFDTEFLYLASSSSDSELRFSLPGITIPRVIARIFS